MGLPAIAVKLYTDENLGMQELDWEHSVIESRPGPVLVISNKSTIPFLLWHIEAAHPRSAPRRATRSATTWARAPSRR
jgi:hypothetical protein